VKDQFLVFGKRLLPCIWQRINSLCLVKNRSLYLVKECSIQTFYPMMLHRAGHVSFILYKEFAEFLAESKVFWEEIIGRIQSILGCISENQGIDYRKNLKHTL